MLISKYGIVPLLIITLILNTSLQACDSCLNPTNTYQANEQQKINGNDKKPQSEPLPQQNIKPSSKTSLEATKKLFEAIEQGNLAHVNAFIEQGADVNATNTDGYSPLLMACWATSQTKEIVQALIDSGANTQFVYDHCLLSFAVASSKPEIFQLLLQSKAKDLIDHTDHNGLTALHRALALYSGDDPNMFQNIKLLLENGANPNIQDRVGGVPLIWADRWANIECVRLLLQYHANPNIPDLRSQETILHHATQRSDVDTVRLLLQYGANPNIQNNEHHATPLHLAINKELGNRSNENIEIIKLLLANGARASINLNNTLGFTPLTAAKWMNRADLVALLLE